MKKSILLALVIFIIAAVWIGSGIIGQKPSNNKTIATEKEQVDNKVPEVRVKTLFAEEMEDTINITGQTQASQSVIIRNETEGSIATLEVNKGDNVTQGQLLAKLEVKDRAAKVQEAQQLVNQRRIEYTAVEKLAEKGYSSRIRLSEALAQLDLAKAQLKQAQIELKNINIYAPFDGIINDKFIELGDYLSKGADLFHLVQLNPIEVRGFATEKQIPYLEKDTVITATLLGKQKISGYISFIASAANEQTRTFAFDISSTNEDMKIKQGLTTTIHIPIKESQAYKIPPSSLSLSDNGNVGVKTINKNNKVIFTPVTLLKDSANYIWVSGLPPSIKLITVGHEFVIEGQTVKPITETDISTKQDS